MAEQIEVYQSQYTGQQIEDAMGAVLSIGENGNWFIGANDTGVFAGGVKVTGAKPGQIVKINAVDDAGRPTAWKAVDADADVYELITSVTIEEAVTLWEHNFKNTPMKKIWVYLETPAHTTDTNYAQLCVSTDPGGVSYVRSKAPLIYPVPRKNACKQEIYVEAQNRSGEYVLVFHDAVYTNNSAIGVSHGLITMGGKDGYGNPLNGQITFVKLSTYQIFDVGAKIEVWGVRA